VKSPSRRSIALSDAPRAILLKIDVEGFELEALAGPVGWCYRLSFELRDPARRRLGLSRTRRRDSLHDYNAVSARSRSGAWRSAPPWPDGFSSLPHAPILAISTARAPERR